MFLDCIELIVRGGKGGNGVASFRRAKYVEKGGPDGGNGGRGGSVFLVADNSLSTFNSFRFKNEFQAGLGGNGEGCNRYGKYGEDLEILVPCGTQIKNKETGMLVFDLKNDGDRFLVAKGGRGGRGNESYKSSINQVPRLYEKGAPGEEKRYVLELKLIADVGLVGLPNGGKSTLLSRYSNARPKIANYPFTTIEPMLGMVNLSDYREFVIADIPGLIEGAHEGQGLGDRFLRHVERTRVLLHVIDFSSENIMENYEMICGELRSFSEKLARKKMLVACNKIDLTESRENYETLREKFLEKGIPVYPISGVTGEGLEDLGEALYELCQNIEEESYMEEVPLRVIKEEKPYAIKRRGNVFEITGPKIERLSVMLDLETHDGLVYFKRKLDKMGVFNELRKMGIEAEMIVKIYHMELVWV